jgi:hypothetical protein
LSFEHRFHDNFTPFATARAAFAGAERVALELGKAARRAQRLAPHAA